ncbi:DUF6903 family protein [Neobacillus massiliamazoniensis]|uniref:Uncharacterized protein n=1 Tax=Neobacillus massiliamazoniensis TaxID=1499688 RepID=A0A0U1NTB6_9BACI|nr:hypothetical protein [Neobacillus massiliamazoniensis]CRK81311.1 hypothetical protein BN000_01211 [Neobacillus massiliamazoniensis]
MNRSSFMIVIKLIVFILCISLIIMGKNEGSKINLAIMLIGLVGLLWLLYDYNRKYI